MSAPHAPNHAHPAHHVHETAPLHDAPDQWHDHSHDESPQNAHTEVGNARAIMGIGIALFLTVVVCVVAVYVYYIWYVSNRVTQQEIAEGYAPSIQAREEKIAASAALDRYDWVVLPAVGETPARTLIRVPVKTAAARVASDYAQAARQAPASTPSEPAAPQ